MDYKKQIEKIAASKVQKMINAGRLGEDTMQKLFESEGIANNLNNRINARAKRLSGGIFPKKQMDANTFNRISNPNNLKDRAIIDTKRLMKYQGHENAKSVSELRRQAISDVSIKRTSDYPLDAGTNIRFKTDTGRPYDWDIELPKKDADLMPRSFGVNASSKAAKELRAVTARHELSGEAQSQSKMLRSLKSNGYAANTNNLDTYVLNDHNNPNVLWGDGAMVKRMSPETQKLYTKKGINNDSGLSHDSINGGAEMNESQALNRLRKPQNQYDFSKSEARDIENTPFFKKKLPTKQEQIDTMKNYGRIRGLPPEVNDEITQSYFNTPFFHTRR